MGLEDGSRVLALFDLAAGLFSRDQAGGAKQTAADSPEEPEIAIEGPNPTRGAFAVKTPAHPGQIAQLEIFDLLGRTLYTQTMQLAGVSVGAVLIATCLIRLRWRALA